MMAQINRPRVMKKKKVWMICWEFISFWGKLFDPQSAAASIFFSCTAVIDISISSEHKCDTKLFTHGALDNENEIKSSSIRKMLQQLLAVGPMGDRSIDV